MEGFPGWSRLGIPRGEKILGDPSFPLSSRVDATKFVNGRDDGFTLLFRQRVPPISLQLLRSFLPPEPPLPSSHNLPFDLPPPKKLSSFIFAETTVPTSEGEEEDVRVVGEPGVRQGEEGRQIGG